MSSPCFFASVQVEKPEIHLHRVPNSKYYMPFPRKFWTKHSRKQGLLLAWSVRGCIRLEEANGRHLRPDKTPEFWVTPEWKSARVLSIVLKLRL